MHNTATTPLKSTGAPVINFATTSHPALSKLIAAFDAAEKKYGLASMAADTVAHPSLTGRAKHVAERRLSRAELALEKAEQALVDYRPANASDAVTLLSFASRGQAVSCFTCDSYDLRAIMANAAAAIAAEA